MRRRQTARVDQIDRHIGERLRERRVMLGLTQEQLAEILGVAYQQLHKYERAINRISAGRLYELAQALNVPVSYFYAGAEEDTSTERLPTPHQRRLLAMMRSFDAISDPRLQEMLNQLARSLAAA